jgi:hypothetical protein
MRLGCEYVPVSSSIISAGLYIFNLYIGPELQPRTVQKTGNQIDTHIHTYYQFCHFKWVYYWYGMLQNV